MLDENNKASVYERHNESSIIPPSEKLFLKYWLLDSFYYRVLLLLKTRAKRVPFAFAVGVSGLVLNKVTKCEIYHDSEKVPFVCPCKIFLLLISSDFSPSFSKNCP